MNDTLKTASIPTITVAKELIRIYINACKNIFWMCRQIYSRQTFGQGKICRWKTLLRI